MELITIFLILLIITPLEILLFLCVFWIKNKLESYEKIIIRNMIPINKIVESKADITDKGKVLLIRMISDYPMIGVLMDCFADILLKCS